MSAPSADWYPAPDQPGTLRYWDGDNWTQHFAPAPARTKPPMSAGTLMAVIAAGILLAVLAVVVGYQLLHANDGLECATENAQRAENGEPQIDCG